MICLECLEDKPKTKFRVYRGRINTICIDCYEKKKKRSKSKYFCTSCRQKKPREEFEKHGKKIRNICIVCWEASYKERQNLELQSRIQKMRIDRKKFIPGIYMFDELSVLQIEKYVKRYWIAGVEHVRE
ncbi:MAG: hypothetical protein ACTSUK_07260 [Promethearchaeota archaeon]